MTSEEAYRAGYQAGKLSMPEIVRCRDCDYVCDYSDIYKKEPFKCTISGKFHNADWFCADAKKVVNCND